MPVATKTGLKESETKIPANRHSIHTGKFAPATLITGLHPEMNNKKNQQTRRGNRKLIGPDSATCQEA